MIQQGRSIRPTLARRNLLSIVIPAHNEEENIDRLYAALCAATRSTCMEFEIIFVDDGSKDKTCDRVTAFQALDKRVRLVALTRNFGHQSAVLAGMNEARGDAVVSMDCDLQHPPTLIPDMVEAWRSGAAVVEMIRDETEDASWSKRVTSRFFYHVINILSDTAITPGAADFRLLDRKPLDDLLRLCDQRLFLRGMIAWMGYPRVSLHYVAAARAAGRSSYTVRRMISLAVDAITAFSAKPLRIAFYGGVIANLLTLCYLVLIVYRSVRGEVVEGWTSLMLVVLFLGATQLMTLGVLGEYVGRIYDQTRGRPRYLVLQEPEADPAEKWTLDRDKAQSSSRVPPIGPLLKSRIDQPG
jgi:polyisoprenyl-phosphate glycosyltransferase